MSGLQFATFFFTEQSAPGWFLHMSWFFFLLKSRCTKTGLFSSAQQRVTTAAVTIATVTHVTSEAEFSAGRPLTRVSEGGKRLVCEIDCCLR